MEVHPISPPPDDMALAFGPFVLSPGARALRRDGAPVALGERPFDLLLLLVARAGDVVGKREISARLWPGDDAERSRLRAHVALLRRVLGEGELGRRYIVNVPGRGYAFVAPVRRQPVARPVLAPALPTPVVRSLPSTSMPVLGREEAVAALVDAIRARRLVTVVGAGGLGKSMTALVAAARLAPEFAGGVAYVDLATLADSGRLAQAVAAVLDAGPVGTLAELCAVLDGRRLLLVLDNCAHMTDSVALLAEGVLEMTTDVRLLATSREALCLHSEWVYRLAPLAPPPAAPLPEQALTDPALRLFALHAGVPALSACELTDVAALCRELDGNPLAIGLAAARAAALGIVAIGGLETLFPADEDAANLGAGRHRSLDAMLDWSWRLLDARERTVLARLSVFRGPFGLGLAAQVCSCGQLDANGVADSILVLSQRSLVEVEDADPAPRYRLVNTTRAYARRRLARSGELAALALRHATAMLALYRAADADLHRMGGAAWRERYGGAIDDFGAALDWAMGDQGAPALGVELAASGWFVMIECGRVETHRRHVRLALDALAHLRQPPADLELRLLVVHVLLLGLCHADPMDAAPSIVRLETLARTTEPRMAVQALHALAGWTMSQGEYGVVRKIAERMAPLAGGLSDSGALLLAYRFRAQALHCLGMHGEAARTAGAVIESPTVQRHVHYLGPAPRTLPMLAVLARTAWIQGRPDQAWAQAQEALALAEGGHPFATCFALGMAALPVALWRGDRAQARALRERLGREIDDGAASYWRPWRDVLAPLLEREAATLAPGMLAALPVPLRDLLATVDPRLVDAASLRRVRSGTLGWCAPEVLRAHGERLLGAGAADHRARALAEGYWLAARALARRQGAAGWELRIATGLAALWDGTTREAEGWTELRAISARFAQGACGADVERARTLLKGADRAAPTFPCRARLAIA